MVGFTVCILTMFNYRRAAQVVGFTVCFLTMFNYSRAAQVVGFTVCIPTMLNYSNADQVVGYIYNFYKTVYSKKKKRKEGEGCKGIFMIIIHSACV